MVAIVGGVRPAQVNQGPQMQAIFHCRLGHELPHTFRNPFPRHGTADVGIKIALLQGKIEKLLRQSLGQHLFGNLCCITILPRCA